MCLHFAASKSGLVSPARYIEGLKHAWGKQADGKCAKRQYDSAKSIIEEYSPECSIHRYIGF
jgi:hypothetical protein